MDPAEIKKTRQQLGLTQAELGKILDTNPSTIRRWEMPHTRSSASIPNPIAVRVMTWMAAGFRPPEWPKNK